MNSMGQISNPVAFEALELMQSALKLLDESGVSADVGAHLDLAICRLQFALGVQAAKLETPWLLSS